MHMGSRQCSPARVRGVVLFIRQRRRDTPINDDLRRLLCNNLRCDCYHFFIFNLLQPPSITSTPSKLVCNIPSIEGAAPSKLDRKCSRGEDCNVEPKQGRREMMSRRLHEREHVEEDRSNEGNDFHWSLKQRSKEIEVALFVSRRGAQVYTDQKSIARLSALVSIHLNFWILKPRFDCVYTSTSSLEFKGIFQHSSFPFLKTTSSSSIS
ncbi:unnamed protein product [Vicia faba]|uniref:Uncharacterized protein n=1 Tax=Vicia faba TaxID=3906 RepID=A0AAV0YWF6_VICFA|nr:unnamed protein product [Vicia faba]